MHDLGDILYFKDNEELNDLVILDPEWMNEKISRVLESKEVIKKDGTFTRAHMDKLWGDVEDENIRQHFASINGAIRFIVPDIREQGNQLSSGEASIGSTGV